MDVTPLPDWANFNDPSLVGVISSKLTSISDFIRFRAVCRSWELNSLQKPRNLQPLLIIPFDSTSDDKGIRSFFDMSEMRRMINFHLPETVGFFCCGSHRGWLLLINKRNRQTRLLNPLTRSTVELPPFTGEITIKGQNENAVPDVSGLCEKFHLGLNPVKKFCLSAEPSEVSCRVSLLLAQPSGLFFCEVGGENWSMVSPCPHSLGELTDVTPIKEQIIFSYKKHLVIVQENEPEIVVTLNNSENGRVSVVEGDRGVYVVCINIETEALIFEEDEPEGPILKMELYRLKEKPFELETVTGDNMTIYIGEDYSDIRVVDSKEAIHQGKAFKVSNSAGVSHYHIFVGNISDGHLKILAQEVARKPIMEHFILKALWFQPQFFL